MAINNKRKKDRRVFIVYNKNKIVWFSYVNDGRMIDFEKMIKKKNECAIDVNLAERKPDEGFLRNELV